VQVLSRLSWKWRKRSAVKITERTREEATEALHGRGKGRCSERRLVENVAVSDLCEELGLQSTVFYRWQKEFFENGAAAFEQKRGRNHQAEQERIEYLEKKIQTKDEVLAELMAEHIALRKPLGNSDRCLVPHDVRDQVVDFVRCWSEKTEIGTGRFIEWLGVKTSKFYDWRERYGKANEHNAWVPRDSWLEDREKKAIIDCHLKNPLEGYRRLIFMMLDQDIVAVSPSSVRRVLGQAGLLAKWNGQPSKKGTGFAQPPAAHEHWPRDNPVGSSRRYWRARKINLRAPPQNTSDR
jgi:putative transposase